MYISCSKDIGSLNPNCFFYKRVVLCFSTFNGLAPFDNINLHLIKLCVSSYDSDWASSYWSVFLLILFSFFSGQHTEKTCYKVGLEQSLRVYI